MHTDLNDLFAEARRTPSEPSPDLLARIMADAEDNMARPVTAPPAPVRSPWRFLGWLLGVSGASAGMASAAIAGVWVGFSQPDTVSRVTAAYWAVTSVEVIPTYDFLTDETQ
ncbi:hypothetical protein [Falsirhodobacter sp. alg1]|uniref:hypothetical protein n=1 Tax=Falsirhodobacter sp. alg1 TaxID=1472418 RepID=UPI0005EF85D3|nr:hypothetical protein [Falsirhodobacter sp. alg1]